MKRSIYLRRFRRLAILGAVVAGLTASSAAAVPMLDPQSGPAVSHTTALGVRADGLRWQGIAKAYQQSGQTAAGHTTALGVRADGLRWQGIAKAYQQSGQQTPAPASSGNSDLNWGDFGIGAGAMFGLALLVTAVGLGAVSMRHRAGKLGTS
jgi:hypothetical protein